MNNSDHNHKEFAERGDDIFERVVRPALEPDVEATDFVAIDLETGEFEVGHRELDAINALTNRCPEARGRVWLRRVGSPIAHRIGGGFRRAG